MGWFDLWREDGRNTYFSTRRSAVLADVSLVLVISFSVILVASLFMVIIGTRGKTRWATFVKVLFSLQTGVSILLTLFGQDWQMSDIQTNCPYSVVERHSLHAYISVHVGLKCVNITMRGDIRTQYGFGQISYNERFHFNKANDMPDDFNRAIERGVPQAILYIAEYFAVDGGGLRWQRAIRMSGHLAFILLWSSFAAWLVSNLLLLFAVFQGAALFTLTGAMMVTSTILYHTLQPGFPLVIPFQDAYIQLSYGWCFWLVALSGAITFICGCAILVVRKLDPLKVNKFFLLDSTHLTDDFLPEPPKRSRFLSVVPDDDGSEDLYYFDERRNSVYSNKAYEYDDDDDDDDSGTPPSKCGGQRKSSIKKDIDLGETGKMSLGSIGSISSGGSCFPSADEETLPRCKAGKQRPSVSFVDETRTKNEDS